MVFFKKNFNLDLEKMSDVRRCPIRTVRYMEGFHIMILHETNPFLKKSVPLEGCARYRECPLQRGITVLCKI